MNHSHSHCAHAQVKFCSHCNVVYCLGCSQEWKKIPDWTYLPFYGGTTAIPCGTLTAKSSTTVYASDPQKQVESVSVGTSGLHQHGV